MANLRKRRPPLPRWLKMTITVVTFVSAVFVALFVWKVLEAL